MEPNHPHFKIADLIAKQLREELSGEEVAILNTWRAAEPGNEAMYTWLTDPVHLQQALNTWPEEPDEIAWQSMLAALPAPASRYVMLKKVLRYAAVLAAGVICISLLYVHRSPEKNKNVAWVPEKSMLTVTDIRPLGKVAKLILENGNIVKLDSNQAPMPPNAGALRNSGGQLSYAAGASKGPVVFNTVITPRGGEYKLVLPDGSEVWLNNASSLRFPTQFTGAQRQVFLSGEAYFEIAADARHPFIVTTSKSNIRVLGTHFNVRSYSDERYESTTLTAGLVQVVKNNAAASVKPVLLKPGFEAVITGEDAPVLIDKADLESTLAWQKGLFVFDGATLDDVMQRVARWYDVSIVYHLPANQPLHFTGRIRKYENISGLLHLLELTRRVHFVVLDRTVHVYPSV